MRTRQWKRVLPVEEYHRRAREDFSSVYDVVLRPEYEIGTEPEYEGLVPNTGQIRAVTAEEIAQDAKEKSIAGAPGEKFATHELTDLQGAPAGDLDPNTGKSARG